MNISSKYFTHSLALKKLLLFLTYLICISVNSQTLKSSSINNGGDRIKDSVNSFSYTIGQPVVGTISNNEFLRRGFQQPSHKVTTIGCTDSLACNYDYLALIDDSSCYFKLFTASVNQVNDSLVVYVNDGVPPYSYLWNNNATTNKIFPNQSGLYWVVVHDANQCSSDTIYYQFNVTSSQILEFDKELSYKIFNLLGQEAEFKYNSILIFVYNDGTVRKRYFFKP